MTIGTVALAVAAGAAYLDARLHISKDVRGIWRAQRGRKEFEASTKGDRASLWYLFEDVVRRMPTNEQAIWSRTGSYTWAETYDNACRYGQFFLTHGVQPGELVALYLMNSPEFVFSYLGAWALGSAPALINYNLTGDALIHCLKLGGSRILLVDEESDCRQRIEECRSRIEDELGIRIIVLDTATKQELLSLKPARPADTLRQGVTPAFPMCLIYTSGTTGLPKACPFPIARAWTIGKYRQKANNLKLGPGGDRWYDCMPMYHGTGTTVMAGCLIAGVTLCIGRKFSISRFWDDVRDSGATTFVYVGETARYFVNAPPNPRDKDHNIKSVWGNGMRPDVWERFRERFGVPNIVEFFNSTEGMFGLFNNNSGPYTAAAVGHHGAIVRRMFLNTYIPVALDHEKGDIWRDPITGFAKRVPYEEGGEIVVALAVGGETFPGYWNNKTATDKKYVTDLFEKGDVYYRTGDALRRTPDGRWYFMDRLGDTFRWKGENVSTAEVAEVLGRYDGVAEANVYGVELPAHDGRAGCAALFIDPARRADFDYSGFLAHARAHLPRYAVPLFLRIIDKRELGHNNKQNKVPFRNEGVEHDKIKRGVAGTEDKLLWIRGVHSTKYEDFSESDWAGIVNGKSRL